jgi:Major Facilitator Superfamily
MPRAPREIAAVALGVGTAFVDPTLLAAIGDVAHPSWRASAVGVYRIWRDSGYAIGALIAGITADVVGLRGAILTIAALTAASGLLAARLLTETHTVGETTMARTKVSHPLFARFYAWASPRMEKAGYGERRGQLLAGLTGECSRWVRTTARTSLTTQRRSSPSWPSSPSRTCPCRARRDPSCLRPGGELLFFEHVRADTAGLAGSNAFWTPPCGRPSALAATPIATPR